MCIDVLVCVRVCVFVFVVRANVCLLGFVCEVARVFVCVYVYLFL